MSWVQPRGAREGRRQRVGEEEEEERKEDGLDSYCDMAMNQMTYETSGKPLERHLDVPHGSEMPPGTRPRNLVPRQRVLQHAPLRKSPLGWQEERRVPPPRNLSPSWEEETRLPPHRKSSPGWQGERGLRPQRTPSPDWHEERPLADSDTLPAHWRNGLPVNKETRDTNQGDPMSEGAKVHFRRRDERRQRTPEEDNEEEQSGSSSGNSLGGSMASFERGDSKPDDRNLSLSHIFDVIEREGDEDGFVHVSRGNSGDSPSDSPHGRRP